MSTAQERLETAVNTANEASRNVARCDACDLDAAEERVKQTTDAVIVAYKEAKSAEGREV